VDEQGLGTTNPADMYTGSLLPLGSTREMGAHKGYCLSAMVDILCAVLSGANWGPFAPPFAVWEKTPKGSVGKGIGHFFGAMEIDGFEEIDVFKKRIDHWIEVFRNTKPIAGQKEVLIPGDPEREAEEIRTQNGIPLIQAVVKDLQEISAIVKIPFEWEKNCIG